MTCKKYELLNNKEWLYNKYITENIGIREISKIIGAKSTNSVRQNLIKHNIPIRSISDGLTINRIEESFILNDSVIDGCLLGDASLIKYNKDNELSFPYFKKKNKHKDHIEFVAKQILKENYELNITEEKFRYKNTDKTYYNLRTQVHRELLEKYNKWYPKESNFIKVIPSDLNIDEIMLLHWFMDDGSSYRRIREGKSTKQIYITFSSESFNRDDQEYLAEKIKNKYSLNMRVGKCNFGTGWRTFINQSSNSHFLEIIGICPVKNMEYKWKYK